MRRRSTKLLTSFILTDSRLSWWDVADVAAGKGEFFERVKLAVGVGGKPLFVCASGMDDPHKNVGRTSLPRSSPTSPHSTFC